MILFHLKIDARKLDDDEFFSLAARLTWVIEEEQKRNQVRPE